MKEIKILDHGYVKEIEFWGSDKRIIESARMSTDGSFRGWGPIACKCRTGHDTGSPDPDCKKCKGSGSVTGDEKLLKYLYIHKHMTPFEMCGATFEIYAPIFVFREWQRHRTQSYNELSARYTPLPDVNYLPTIARCMISDKKNKQSMPADLAEAVTQYDIEKWLRSVERIYRLIQDTYETGLNCGVPKEVARIVVPVGRYSRMRASGNLRNWMQFLTLRMEKNAQLETRQYANAVHNVLSERFPRTLELFNENT